MNAATGAARFRAGANFALIKYWGKRQSELNLPEVGSISITLEALFSDTRVTFDPALDADQFELDGHPDAAAGRRVGACLDRLRALAGVRARARVESLNNFPTGAGLASSASGFAALVAAAAAALELELNPAELSALARQGSGSAARSIFGGFVEMARGERPDGLDAVARQILAPEAWPLEVVVAITAAGGKTVGSTEGMLHTARTSPFYAAWVEVSNADLEQARRAIADRDFESLSAVSEASALAMHGLAMAARPGLLYWNSATVACLHRIRELRDAGLPVFFTVDAGPQVKAICPPEYRQQVAAELAALPGVERILTSALGPGVRRLGESGGSA